MTPNEKLVPGTVLGRYELLLPIAQGGMATVWAARQKGSRGFQKTVAIKTMLPTLSDDAQFEQMFLDEAALAAKIHHPNVVEILDLGEQDEVLYLVMEWVDGEALSLIHKTTRKAKVDIPLRVTLRVLAQACAGLHAAHELKEDDEVIGLVHRDVSPQNVLVTYEGNVKLVDFGVAKAMNRGGGETTAGQLKGKVPYMSPEQARGHKVDRRTDIFAMGIVLYKLTTGLHPFMGDTDIVTMRNIISKPLLPPRVKMPSYNAELEQVVLKCLQKDADKRYSTMHELEAALEKVLVNLGGADDVGEYVRALMGERGTKRRNAIRDAARAADELVTTGNRAAVTTGTHPAATALGGAAELKTGSGVTKEELVPETGSNGSNASTSLVHTTSQPVASSPRPDQPADVSSGRGRRVGVIAIACVLGLAGLAGAFLLATSRRASPPASVAAATTAIAAPENAQAPSPAVTASASAPAASATSATVSVDDLPTSEDAPQRGARATRPGAPIGQRGVKEAPSAASTAKTPHTVATQWVPSVQNPGF